MGEQEKVIVRKRIPASREEVFAAWTNGQDMAQWMCPGEIKRADVKLDLRVGGAFRIVMRYDDPNRQDYEHTGEFRVVEPPSKLVFTWRSRATDGKETLVTVELKQDGDECEVTLAHERFPRLEVVPGHQKGWTEILDKLAAHMERRKGARA